MNFKLESYDTRHDQWMGCTLFAHDFAACQTPEEAQSLLDRMAVSYNVPIFRVRYDSVLTPRVNAPDLQTIKQYKLEFYSKEYKNWVESTCLRGPLAKCQNDGEAEQLLDAIKKEFCGVDYRIHVYGNVPYFLL